MSAQERQRVIVLCRSEESRSAEWAWAQRLCEELLRGPMQQEQLVVLSPTQPSTVGDILATTSASTLGIVLDDHILWGLPGWDSLHAVLDQASHIVAVAPVSNETGVSQQRVAPPFLYSTPSLLRQAAAVHYDRYRHQWQEVAAFDPFAFLLRRTALNRIDAQTPITQVPQVLKDHGAQVAVALDTYVHRYASVYEQVRPDIQAWVPSDARHILDIGCAVGLFGAALKQRQDCHVTGIELSPSLAETARARLDRVVVANVETLEQAMFVQAFDCITCGDVLEHLRDPWALVAKCATWLRPGGRFIATTPNIGHWSIVRDLLQGRWDIVPFSLLSWEHLRFFTRAGIEQLLHGCGLTVEQLQGMVNDPSPIGADFLQRAVTLMPEADLDSLRTHEFLVVARKEAR